MEFTKIITEKKGIWISDSYEKTYKEIQSELKRIQDKIKKYKKGFDKLDKDDWGYIGDLEQILSQLKQI